VSKLRIVDARTMEKVLFYVGFERARQKGSHVFYRPLARPLMREILWESKITVDEYNKILDGV
jgi:hypothetical protein